MVRKKTLSEFIEESKNKYGDKFNYSLSKYNGGNKLITMQCSNNHIFTTYPSVHLSKKSKGGCSKCHFNNLPTLLTKYNQESFIKKVSEIHNMTYDYSKTIYKDLHTSITITCKIHGDFIQTPVCHLHHKHGCNECGKIKTMNARILSANQIEEKLNKFRIIHKNKYEYGQIFRDNQVLWLEIICPLHGNHITRFFNHEKGHGCPKCVSVSSKIQIEWLEYCAVRDGFIQHIGNMGEYIIPNTKYCVDGYNMITNTIYEFQGDFWHGNPDIYDLNAMNTKLNVTFGELYFSTIDKIKLLKDMGFKVIEMWENDWRNGIKAVKKLQRVWRLKHKKIIV